MKTEHEEYRRNQSLCPLRGRRVLQTIEPRQRENEEKLELIENLAPSQAEADSTATNELQNSEKQTQVNSP
jgi:hypothetical protein